MSFPIIIDVYKRQGTVAGVDFRIEEPKYPDLILQNDGDLTPEQQLQAIEPFLG